MIQDNFKLMNLEASCAEKVGGWGSESGSWFLGDLGFGLVSGWFRMVLGGFD